MEAKKLSSHENKINTVLNLDGEDAATEVENESENTDLSEMVRMNDVSFLWDLVRVVVLKQVKDSRAFSELIDSKLGNGEQQPNVIQKGAAF